jgi:hypothetical protein
MSVTIIKKTDETEDEQLVTVSSVTAAIGDVLYLPAGAVAWIPLDSSYEGWMRAAVVAKAVISANTTALVREISPYFTVEVTATNNTAVTDNGDRMIPDTQAIVNNTHSDSAAQGACFIQYAMVGATAEKRMLGKWICGSGINPDAT